ncbi:MAG: hypothetical protein OXU23_27230 [Candidatus Poribacteria bacterium]|nr:hypothetical protein [Candidatus Poribacteria bacterium]
MKQTLLRISIWLLTLPIIAVLSILFLTTTGCDEGEQMVNNVITEPVEPTTPKPTDPVTEIPTTTGDIKKPEPTKPAESTDTNPEEQEPETKEPELEPADTTPPTVVRVVWYANSRLKGLMLNNRNPGVTVYAKVVFSEPVEHIIGNDASARPALSLVVNGQAARLGVLPHNAGNRAFVSGTCKPLAGDTDTFACSYTIPAGSIGTVTLQVGEETADTAGNAAAESHHIAPFMIEEPPPPKTKQVVPALKTLVPATSPEHLPPPESDPGDFVGQIRTLYSTNGISVNSTQPLPGVSVTITAGPRAGEQVTTDQGGYYLFPNSSEDELYLRVEKEHFEPKEVIVDRARPTVLQRPAGPTLTRGDPWNTPGTVVIGQRWPDAVRFIFEETLLPNDILFVRSDGYRSYQLSVGAYKSSGIITIFTDRTGTNNDMLMLFAHELGHAHQHAVEITNNTDSWSETPEGRAYARAREKDWEEVDRTTFDKNVANNYHEDAHLTEGAAEVSTRYWGRGKWLPAEGYEDHLKTIIPNRYTWAEKWLNKK